VQPRTLLLTFCALAVGCNEPTSPRPRLAEEPSYESVRSVVERLDFERYKAIIRALSQFGDRQEGTERNRQAFDWVERQLVNYGYTNVSRHRYMYEGEPRENLYATKVGTTLPGEMYIVSAHLDGIGGGEAADDDASGCAVVLESARTLGAVDVKSARSIRFVFWNNEETGLDGSRAYVADRRSMQGIEIPPGSGKFLEPTWLGVLQHDMVLFDHGYPPVMDQVPDADLDIEYQAGSAMAIESAKLAGVLHAANSLYGGEYPAAVGSHMHSTDSQAFEDFVASVSVRENQRSSEIGRGSNPHRHQSTDAYKTYSEADFALGMTAARTTLGAIGHLARVRVVRQ
jgi:hypothetical protein